MKLSLRACLISINLLWSCFGAVALVVLVRFDPPVTTYSRAELTAKLNAVSDPDRPRSLNTDSDEIRRMLELLITHLHKGCKMLSISLFVMTSLNAALCLFEKQIFKESAASPKSSPDSAPPDILAAALFTLELACVRARNLTLGASANTNEINSLMEAIHSTPHFLGNWSAGRLAELRLHFASFDHVKWPESPDLLSAFNARLAHPKRQTSQAPPSSQ
jgi:hypothetical protein